MTTDVSDVSDATDTLVLRPSRLRVWLLITVGLAFSVGGVLMIRAGESKGWFALVFFGLCTVVFVIQLFPNSSYLRLTPQGFETRSLYRSSTQAWSDVAAFRAGRIGVNAMVLITYAPSYARLRKARAVSSALTGAEGALPDTYGHSAKQLAALLNEWRARHAG
jgi:hypothetical protein